MTNKADSEEHWKYNFDLRGYYISRDKQEKRYLDAYQHVSLYTEVWLMFINFFGGVF